MNFLSDGLLPGRIIQINSLLLELLWLGDLITQKQSETGTEPMVTIQGEVPCIELSCSCCLMCLEVSFAFFVCYNLDTSEECRLTVS